MTATEFRETSPRISPPPDRRRLTRRVPQAGAPAARFDPGKAGDPRKRNPIWLAGGLLLVLACALGGALLFSSADERVAVLVAADTLAPGVPVDRSSFVVAQVAADSNVAIIEPDMVDSLVGRLPAGPIPQGTVISEGLLVDAMPLEADEMIIGVALDPGEAPSDSIEVGVPVELIVVSSADPAAQGQGSSTAQAAGSGVVWGARNLDSGQLFLSVRVDKDIGLVAAAASADDRLRLALVGAEQ
jgi:hypothetical protein